MLKAAKLFCAAVLIAAVALCAPGPNASSERFVVNDNDAYLHSQGNDYATVFRLEGTKQNPVLKQAALLDSGEPSVETTSFTPTIQVVKTSSHACVFMADSNGPESTAPNEITSFAYPSMAPVGSFSDNNVPSPELGIAIVGHGDYLFAAYSGYGINSYVAMWRCGGLRRAAHWRSSQRTSFPITRAI